MQADPILSSFYGAGSERNAAMTPLAEDILVFSTFCRGNQIKWARKPLLEYVLNFCGKTVLARCANLIHWTPLQPSEDVPPSPLEIPTERRIPRPPRPDRLESQMAAPRSVAVPM